MINKCDRPDAEPHAVHDAVFDLFAALDANDAQLDFPTLFASSKQGWAAESLEAERVDLSPLFDLVVRHVPSPTVDTDGPFAMLTTTLEYDNYLGRVLTGRIESGKAQINMAVKCDAPRRDADRSRPPDQAARLPRHRARAGRDRRSRRHHRHRGPDRHHGRRHDRAIRRWRTRCMRSRSIRRPSP